MTNPTKLVQWLGPGTPPAPLLAHLKTRGFVLRQSGDSGPLPPARLSALGAAVSGREPPSLSGRRVAVLHPDPGAADMLAQSLRQKGGTALVLSLDPTALDRVENFDPDAVLVEPSDFMGGCWEIVRALWAHPRLRWTPIVLTPSEPLGFGSLSAPDLDRVGETIRDLSSKYDALLKRAASGKPFEISLDALGPARTLRALLASGATLRVSFQASARAIELDIAERLVVGAQELASKTTTHIALLGPEALGHVLGADEARVSVKSVASPAVTNVMAPLDDALHAARAFSTPAPPRALVRPIRAEESPSARVYTLRAVTAPPAVPIQALGSQAARALMAAQPQAVHGDLHMASAAALNLDVELEPSVIAPGLESAPEGLDSGVVKVNPRDLGDTWQLADLTRLSAARRDSHPAVAPEGVPRDAANDRDWSRGSRAAMVLVVLVIALLARGDGGANTPRASASVAAPALTIRVQRLTPELQRPQLEGSAEQFDEGEQREDLVESAGEQNSTKTGVRRSSALVSEGHAWRREGKHAKAETLYREALRETPGYPRALTGLSRIAIERGDGRAAVTHARALVRVRPNQAASHLLLGDAQRAAGNIAAAKRAWRVAARRGDKVAKRRLLE